MGEKTLENSVMGYSAAYPTGAERCQEDGLVRRLSKRLFWDVPIESIEENRKYSQTLYRSTGFGTRWR